MGYFIGIEFFRFVIFISHVVHMSLERDAKNYYFGI